MGMKVKKNDEQQAAVPLSAMIDVVFLLLIYFIVTQKPIIDDVLLEVKLPGPDAPSNSTDIPEVVRIGVDKYKRDSAASFYYWYNGSPMERKVLERTLKSLAEANRKTTIIIECYPGPKHQKLITLLDMCKTLGLTNINLNDVENPGQAFVQDPPRRKN